MSTKVTSGATTAPTKGVAPSSHVYPALSTPTDIVSRQHAPPSLMSLPNECLMLLIHWVAYQDLFSLLCVNKTFFHLVVPLLYRDPFRLSSRGVWKRSVYKGVIERQTKLIRTLLLCCTRTINKLTPIDLEAEKKGGQSFWLESPFGRAVAVVRRSDKDSPVTTTAAAEVTAAPHGNESGDRHGFEGSSLLTTVSEGTTLNPHNVNCRFNCVGICPPSPPQKGDRSIIKTFLHKLGSSHHQQRSSESVGEHTKAKGKGIQQPKQSHMTKVEKIPIVWDAEKNQPEMRRIPGLGFPNSRLKFPPELAKTVIRFSNEPPPMANYLSYVTHTDVRSWSAASNMSIVHQILGDARSSWHARLQGLVKRTSKRLMNKQSASDRHASTTTMNAVYNHPDMDEMDDEDDGALDRAFSFRHNTRDHRWKRGRGTRNNLWELRDIDFLELLLLFYTSGRMESLSLGMTCSHWYHPSLNVLLKGIPERLSGLRRIVIDHADTIVHNAVPVPQMFIQRHQKAYPGQLREIQVRQSYHYSYDMSKSVLQTIRTMERLEVLDLSIWTGVFSGLESICTEHLRKLFICHHMEVPHPEMFDELLKGCPALEELSIVVPHPRLFSWAVERRHNLKAGVSGNRVGAAMATSSANTQYPGHLPPLRIVTFFGHTSDVVAAFKDVIFAFQDTLESIHISMYSDMTRPTEANFEVPPSHFVLTEEVPQPSTLDIPLLQQPGSSTGSANIPTEPPQPSLGLNTSPGWNAGGAQSSSSPTPSSTPSCHLSWNWPLPKMRTMSLRGPAVATFDMRLLRFCPQLTDLSLSYHCSRLPRLAYPGLLTSKLGRTGKTMTRYPRIMICESLAFKWGMSVQEERRSLILA